MKIIIVADNQASKFILNEENLGFKYNDYVLFADLVRGSYDRNRRVWKDNKWVLLPTRLVVHYHQVTKKFEAERIVSGLLVNEHPVVIVGCDPYISESFLTERLKKVFGEENVMVLHTPLSDERPVEVNLEGLWRDALSSEKEVVY